MSPDITDLLVLLNSGERIIIHSLFSRPRYNARELTYDGHVDSINFTENTEKHTIEISFNFKELNNSNILKNYFMRYIFNLPHPKIRKINNVFYIY